MADAVAVGNSRSPAQRADPSWFSQFGRFAGLAIIIGGVAYCAVSLVSDVEAAPGSTTLLPFLLLGVALLIALGFEFVNGFHDTANAVATVIYTPIHSQPTWRWCGQVPSIF
jgi:hypothetical protein